MPKGTRFSGEFKLMVVEDLRKNHLSYCEAMRKYGIAGKMSIQSWERIYLEEGVEGLYAQRRGRGSSGRPPKQMTKQTEEDLVSENQRLRAENDYLKKLNALVSERVQREKRHRS
jgi:transposase